MLRIIAVLVLWYYGFSYYEPFRDSLGLDYHAAPLFLVLMIVVSIIIVKIIKRI